jgi:hypothetical protein
MGFLNQEGGWNASRWHLDLWAMQHLLLTHVVAPSSTLRMPQLQTPNLATAAADYDAHFKVTASSSVTKKCSTVLTSVDDADVIDPAVWRPPEVKGIPALLPVHASIAGPGHSVEKTNKNILSATEDIMFVMKSKTYVVIAVLAPLCDVMMLCMAALLCICGPNHKARRCTVISMPDACRTHT